MKCQLSCKCEKTFISHKCNVKADKINKTIRKKDFLKITSLNSNHYWNNAQQTNFTMKKISTVVIDTIMSSLLYKTFTIRKQDTTTGDTLQIIYDSQSSKLKKNTRVFSPCDICFKRYYSEKTLRIHQCHKKHGFYYALQIHK